MSRVVIKKAIILNSIHKFKGNVQQKPCFIQPDSMSLFIVKYDMSVETLFSTFASHKFVLHIPYVGGQPLFFCFCTKFKKRSIL
jgi:hypothetical protein